MRSLSVLEPPFPPPRAHIFALTRHACPKPPRRRGHDRTKHKAGHTRRTSQKTKRSLSTLQTITVRCSHCNTSRCRHSRDTQLNDSSSFFMGTYYSQPTPQEIRQTTPEASQTSTQAAKQNTPMQDSKHVLQPSSYIPLGEKSTTSLLMSTISSSSAPVVSNPRFPCAIRWGHRLPSE